PGRLVSETSRSGETVRYRYDDAHSELPATTTDATGSRPVTEPAPEQPGV
ncbi:RHS repeat protein, partial [Escherichia coli]|nr:RHS repeat protein [Escherichia coli]